MNYVAAALLMQLDANDHGRLHPQEASFAMLVGFLQHVGMDDLWRPTMPGLSRCIYLYQQLLRRHFYDLHAHFRHIGFHASVLVTQVRAAVRGRVGTRSGS
jgi:hypothetical protein